MLAYALDAARAATGTPPVVVVSPGMAEVRETFGPDARFAEQAEPRGTADALAAALATLDGDVGELLVLGGDTPFLRPATLQALVAERRARDIPMTLLTSRLPVPEGYGRVLRDGKGRVRAIVEEKDAAPEEQAVDEVNAGVYALDATWTRRRLPDIPPSPSSGELYLTELVRLAVVDGAPPVALAADARETAGINDRVQLAEATRVMRQAILEGHMRAGVTIVDPATTYVDATVSIAPDVTIEPGAVLRGSTSVGEGTLIGTASQVLDSVIGRDCRVWASVLEGAVVEDEAKVGPYAHLRPGAVIGTRARVGNFAEVKQSRLGPGVQQHHFSYVGDAEVGAGANIGAGTVTANFDGQRKNRTIIGEGAFIGSDSMLVAPVEIGAGAMTAAGSVVTHDVPPGKLAVGVPARIREPRRKVPPEPPEAT